jgi:GntR family transcriptional regulator
MDSEPAYVTALRDLVRQIESREILPGDAIPSVAVMCAQYGISGTTAQKVIRALKVSGLVDSVPGKGVYVRVTRRRTSRSADFTSPVPAGSPTPHGPSTPPEVLEVVPPDEVSEKLELDPDETAVRRYRVSLDEDGCPNEIGASYIPVSIARGTELEWSARLKGAVPTALKRAGYPPRTCREWVAGRMPTSEEARILRIPSSTPVLRTLRLTRSDGGRPVEVLVIVFSCEIFELEYDLPIHDEGDLL